MQEMTNGNPKGLCCPRRVSEGLPAESGNSTVDGIPMYSRGSNAVQHESCGHPVHYRKRCSGLMALTNQAEPNPANLLDLPLISLGTNAILSSTTGCTIPRLASSRRYLEFSLLVTSRSAVDQFVHCMDTCIIQTLNREYHIDIKSYASDGKDAMQGFLRLSVTLTPNSPFPHLGLVSTLLSYRHRKL
ncbi:hypothetical protein K461DRAFT_94804 [Myriangium duriaei CBS 260.36]|uniref:Uncharacterized protein n=1 Tax=Myriangium duriaei CBS 260.36 TaxID=1168546 RepID=A0A9P4MKK4_9PEZI|nr:hypothetical protein K461DRAFT_94804 [Myriangium duriaei CBS 260.36]